MGAIGLANTPSPPPMFSALPSQSAPNLQQPHMGMISSGVAAVSGGNVNMNGMPAYGSSSLASISGRSMQQQQGQGQGQGQGAWRAYALPGMPIPDEDVIPTAIVIKNIPFAVPRETLLGVIESLGAPLPYAFNYHHDQGVFRGLAFANFRAPDEAAAVVAALNGYDVSGRKLKVEYKKVLQPGEKDRIEREKALKRMRSVQGFDRDPMGMGMGMGGMGMGQMGMGGMGQQLSPSTSYGGITPSASLGGIGLSTLGSGVMLSSGSGGLQRSNANGLSINSGIAGVSGATSPVGQYQQQQQQGQYQQSAPGQGQSQNQGGQGLATHFEADYSPPPSAGSGDSFTGKPSSGSAHSGGAGSNVSSSSAAADLPTALDMNDPITLDIYSRVLLFKEDRMRDEFAFSRNLSPYERRVVHLVAARLGMTSLTQGDDENGKYVLVLRQAPGGNGNGNGSGNGASGAQGQVQQGQAQGQQQAQGQNQGQRPGLTSSASSSSAPAQAQHNGPPASASAAYHSYHFGNSGLPNGNGNANIPGQGQGHGQGGMLPPNEMTTAALRIKKSMPDLRGFNGPVMSRDPARSLAPQRSSGNLRAQAQAQGQGMGMGYDAYSHPHGRDTSAPPHTASLSTSTSSSTLSPPSGTGTGSGAVGSGYNANAREFVSLGSAAGRRVQINGTPTSMGPPPPRSPGGGNGNAHANGSAPGSYGAERYGWHSSSSSASLSTPAQGQKAESVAGSDRDNREGALSPVSATGSYSAPLDASQQQQQQQAQLKRQPRGPSSESRGFAGVLGGGGGGSAQGSARGTPVEEGVRTRDSLDM